MKKKYLGVSLIILGIIFSTSFAYSQLQSFESPEIEPIEEDKIKMCFEVTVKIIATGKERQKTFCREYPIDLLYKCQYDRYGLPINCKNILKKEVQQDLKNWYKYKLPKEIKTKIQLKDLTLISISHPNYQKWVGCKYDFMTDKITC